MAKNCYIRTAIDHDEIGLMKIPEKTQDREGDWLGFLYDPVLLQVWKYFSLHVLEVLEMCYGIN